MKIKLIPELAYLIGLWRKRRSSDGLGIRGNERQIETFAKGLLDMQITILEKLMHGENLVYTYNTAYRKFFHEVEKEELERFKYLNEYAANYLAGIFDSVGSIEENGIVRISKINPRDEVLFLRLGFIIRRVKDGIMIMKPKAFLAFIKNYVKVHADHRAFKMVGKVKTKP